LRRAILVGVSIFCLDNFHYTPPPPEPEPVVVEVVDDTSERLLARHEWLVYEAMAYALHQVAAIPGDEARELVRLVLDETAQYEDLDYLMVLGLIVVESKGFEDAVSPVGARGIMQIMPATGRFIANHVGEKWQGTSALYEPDTNIRYGVWYLDYLRGLFPENEQAVVAAYNWGPDNIRGRLAKGKALPKVYPGKVWEAEKKLRGEMYEFHRTHMWRSLDLSQDPPAFEDDPGKSRDRRRYRRLLVDAGKSKLLRERPRVQQMSKLVPGGD